jgi:hypothetical protein
MPLRCQKLSVYTFMTLWQEHEKITYLKSFKVPKSMIHTL